MAPLLVRRADLAAIVALLADDPGLPLDPRYATAFDAIAAGPNQLLAAATIDGAVVGTLHLTFSPGLGRQLLAWTVGQSRARGCDLVQLATDRSRTDAHRFYERAGFTASHIGYKLALH